MNKTTWLADVAKWISVSFEELSPALFRLLSAVLPYSTPIPVAWLTMRSTERFLGFTPGVSFTFVFGLEGMGIWFTSLFVDSVIAWIRSRNWKSMGLVLLFGAVVAAYVYLLVNLNVTLEQTTNQEANPVLSRVITLLCFLPLLTGVGNGYYKFLIESKAETRTKDQIVREAEERERERRSKERVQKAALKYGRQDPFSTPQTVYPAETRAVKEKPRDWRNLTDEQKYRVVHILSIKEIMDEFPVSEATAYNWKSKTL